MIAVFAAAGGPSGVVRCSVCSLGRVSHPPCCKTSAFCCGDNEGKRSRALGPTEPFSELGGGGGWGVPQVVYSSWVSVHRFPVGGGRMSRTVRESVQNGERRRYRALRERCFLYSFDMYAACVAAAPLNGVMDTATPRYGGRVAGLGIQINVHFERNLVFIIRSVRTRVDGLREGPSTPR